MNASIDSRSASKTDRFHSRLGGFQLKLETSLTEWLEDKQTLAATEAEDSQELTMRLDEFVLRGGKRLRPALVYFAYEACGGKNEVDILPLAMSLELLHAYLLVHDDIMDRAETRRGAPASHLQFRDDHLRRGWEGDAERNGEAMAMLLGDLAHSYAVELFFTRHAQLVRWPEIQLCFTTMCQEVVVGQYLEMTAPYRSGLSEDDLLQVLRMKSGRYSVERPIQIGALAAAASSETTETLRRFGSAVGEAFQLKDDLLGVFGDLETVGKPVGSDLVEGKCTVLIHRTLAAASTSQKDIVLRVLGNAAAVEEDLQEACAIIEEVGARGKVETMVETRMDLARSLLNGLELTSSGTDFFCGLVEYLKERNS